MLIISFFKVSRKEAKKIQKMQRLLLCFFTYFAPLRETSFKFHAKTLRKMQKKPSAKYCSFFASFHTLPLCVKQLLSFTQRR
jgi:hypothetical protein